MTIIYCVADDKSIIDTFVTIEEANGLVNNMKKQNANVLLLKNAGVPDIMISSQYSYMYSQYNNMLGISDQDISNMMATLTEPHVEEKVIA